MQCGHSGILLNQQGEVALLLARDVLWPAHEQAGHMAGRGRWLLAPSMGRNDGLAGPLSAAERGQEAGHVRFAVGKALRADLPP